MGFFDAKVPKQTNKQANTTTKPAARFGVVCEVTLKNITFKQSCPEG